MKIKSIVLAMVIFVSSALCIGCAFAETKAESETEVATIEITENSYDDIVPAEDIKITAIEEEKINDSLIGSLDFDSDDALMLHKISIAEAGGESVESMALVMLVVLNRVWSDEFPNSIEEVIFQKVNGIAQFTPVVNGSYEAAEPNEKSQAAMELVLSGWNESQNALYFESCSGESWHSRNLELLFEKDGIRFYK